ncbi:MAG: electron transfer flavoprotein-ubiquinone oxidoreductase [Sphingomonadales bacterium]|nr:electron transfer flavoprotein-ubiquinone oxidoreductase [Sphingomonadales bacterium]
MSERESMPYDVVIVGAGPAGLAAAIRLKQLAAEKDHEISVWVLTEGKKYEFPHILMPPFMNNKGTYTGSLGNFCRWLAGRAEALGVEIFPGFAAAEVLWNDDGSVKGVATGDMGISRDGERKPDYQPGMELHAKYTLFAEGVRGHLTKQLIRQFELDANSEPQVYGLGVKELWDIPSDKHHPGCVIHTQGWPLDEANGGGFLYHQENGQVALGFVTWLNYSNPWLSPFEEMQRWKHHPAIRAVIEGGKRVSYGARAINDGGWQSVPKLAFPGGALIGCSAGFVNVPRIKGSHTAMKTGMMGAEAAFEAIEGQRSHDELTAYQQAYEQSWVSSELGKVRNTLPLVEKFGNFVGTILSGATMWAEYLGLRMPFTMGHEPDHTTLWRADQVKKIDYPKPDGVISFDRLSSVFLSNTNHEEDQPCHLTLEDPDIPIEHNLPLYAEPAQRYCPAGVYEVIEDVEGNPKFQINAQNCVHCKTCDIKDPKQNINWVTPQGGGGPNYPNM